MYFKKPLRLNDKDKVLEKLKSKTIYVEDCWKFIGGHRNGYGFLLIEEKMYQTHRLSAYIFHGLDINNPEIQANHKNICTSRCCWNPDHIYLGSQLDNTQDKSEVIQKKEKFPCGHDRFGSNAYKFRNTITCRLCKIQRTYEFKQRERTK